MEKVTTTAIAPAITRFLFLFIILPPAFFDSFFYCFSLPVILVGVIEFAIFVNMGIPFYTGTTLPFVASIVIGTIQLGNHHHLVLIRL